MKPSWAVMKLTDFCGPPWSWKARVIAVDRVDERAGVAVALQEAADRVAVGAVPFGPALGKVADVIAAEVPRLGDDLDACLLRASSAISVSS